MYSSGLTSYEAQQVDHELALRIVFSNLLAHYARPVKRLLISELTLANDNYPMRFIFALTLEVSLLCAASKLGCFGGWGLNNVRWTNHANILFDGTL